jgi:hypothetical protein
MYITRLSRNVFFALLSATMCIGLIACAPSPNTNIDLTKGTYNSAKDIKLQELEAFELGPDGQITRSVKIKGLDSSASSVIEAQAKAMQAQAEAFGAFAGGLDKLAERIPVSSPAGLAAKTLIRGAAGRASSTLARPRQREEEEEVIEEGGEEAAPPASDEEEAEGDPEPPPPAPKPAPRPPRKPAAAKPTPTPPPPPAPAPTSPDPAPEEPS